MATPLDEFIVTLGFKVDESGAQRFRSSTQKSGTETDILNKKVKELEATVKRLQEAFQKTAAEPVRKFSEFGQKIGQTASGIASGIGNIVRTTAAVGGAFTGFMATMANRYNELSRTASRIGTSAKDLEAIRRAADAAGIGADNITASMLAVDDAVKSSGGAVAAYIKRWTGTDWRTAGNKARDVYAPMMEELAKQSPMMDQFHSKVIGVPVEAIRQWRAAGPAMREALVAAWEQADKTGKNYDEMKRNAAEFRSGLTQLGQKVEDLGTSAFAKAQPAFKSLFDAIGGGIDAIIEKDKDYPGLGLAAASAAALSGLQTIVPALKTIGINVNLLNPYMLGLAAAGAMIMANWETIGPFLEQSFKKITEAYKREGLEGAFRETVRVIREDIKWEQIGEKIGELIQKGIQLTLDFAKWLRNLPWQELGNWVGRKLGEFIAGGFEFDAQAMNRVKDVLLKIADVGFEIGFKLAAGISEGLAENVPAWSWLKRTIGDPTGTALGKLATRKAGEGATRAVQLTPEMEARLQELRGPSAQRGGVVSAQLHEGEMVLPANISKGLQRIIRGMDAQQFGGAGVGLVSRADERLEQWLGGSGAVPKVNIDEDTIAAGFLKGAAKLLGIKGVGMMTYAAKGGQRMYRDVTETMEETGMGPLGALGKQLFGTSTQERIASALSRKRGGPGVAGAAGGPGPGQGTREDPRGMIPVIRAAAAAHGIDPDTAIRVARSEGLSSFASMIPVAGGGTEQSFGAFQLFMGGGLGNEFQKETGLDPSDPANEAKTIWWTMKKVREGGWGPWKGAKKVGITGRKGIGAMPASGGLAGGDGQAGLQGDYAQRMGWSQQQAAKQLVTIKSASGASFRVHQEAAPQFQGLINELEAGGYFIDPKDFGAGGFNPRQKVGGGKGWSSHAYGTAIDINPARNPLGGKGHDFPADIGDIAARHGLRYGGAPGFGIRDWHHFEVARLGGVGNRMQDANIGGQMLNGNGITNNMGDRNVAMNVTHNVNVFGGAGTDAVSRFIGADRRVWQDTQRDFQGVIA